MSTAYVVVAGFTLFRTNCLLLSTFVGHMDVDAFLRGPRCSSMFVPEPAACLTAVFIGIFSRFLALRPRFLTIFDGVSSRGDVDLHHRLAGRPDKTAEGARKQNV